MKSLSPRRKPNLSSVGTNSWLMVNLIIVLKQSPASRAVNPGSTLQSHLFNFFLIFVAAESDICTFAVLKQHYAAKCDPDTNLFTAETRPRALQALYEAATKTPVHLMRQLDRWRRDGHRSSRFFLCTPVLGNKRRKIRNKVDIDIETRMVSARLFGALLKES
jgi:hypothetical protein